VYKKNQVHQITHKLEGHLTPFLIVMECMEKIKFIKSQVRRTFDSFFNNDGVHEKKASSSSHSQVRKQFDSLSNNDEVHGKKSSSSSHSQLRRQFDFFSNDDKVHEEEFESGIFFSIL